MTEQDFNRLEHTIKEQAKKIQQLDEKVLRLESYIGCVNATVERLLNQPRVK
jgi:archaellum component FlaC